MNPPEPGADVEQLLEVSASGPLVLADLLDACVRHLREIQAATSALAARATEDAQPVTADWRQQPMAHPGSKA